MRELIFTDGDFSLYLNTWEKGEGEDKKEYQDLQIKIDGLASKHVVDVRLDYHGFREVSTKRKYYNVYVSHGMRMTQDSLAETQEYIEVLQKAVEFAKRVETYCKENDWWDE